MLSSLWQRFRQNLNGVAVVPGGELCPPGQGAAWCEVWIDNWGSRAVRNGQRGHGQLVCTAHLFIRPELQLEAATLARQCRNVLSQVTTFEADDYSPGSPQGTTAVPVRWNEGEVRESTRLDRQQTGSTLRHFICTWEGQLAE
jgi:hypothetical protein